MVAIIEADNLICGKCAAGNHGCSICWNGDVIPCLSYRAWKNDLDVQGNIFKESLKYIWENKFEFYRNREFFPCCKCITGIELLKKKNTTPNIVDILKGNGNDQSYIQPPIIPNVPYDPNDPNIPDPNVPYVYGVGITKGWVVYGVNISINPTSFN